MASTMSLGREGGGIQGGGDRKNRGREKRYGRWERKGRKVEVL